LRTATDVFETKEFIAQPETKLVPTYNRKLTKNIVSTMAYLLGIKTQHLESLYLEDCPDFIKTLDENTSAKTIRILSQLRTTMLREYVNIENNLNNLINIDKMPAIINNEDLKWLRKNGIEVIKANTTTNQYIISINKLILDNIDKCKSLIPSWIVWEYIRDLFLMPGCYTPLTKNMKSDAINKAKKKYYDNKAYYPYQVYMNWPKATMEDNGNILMYDEKFLVLLYEARGVDFIEYGRVRDAGNAIKMNIQQFIENSEKTALIVDCENCDVYNLFSTLHNLSPQAVQKLSKVILFDDQHTTGVWSLISKFVKVPVEHLQIDRVAQHKSLVDISLTAGVCREYFQNKTESFILASSDSDFWGLVKALPEAKFLMLIEYSKCGTALKEAMSRSGIYYCAMDDFGKGNIEEFKEMAFKASLQEYVNEFNESGIWPTSDVDDIVDSIFENCRFTGTEKQIQSDKSRYLNKYIKALRFEVVDDKLDNKRRLKMTIGA